MGAATNPIELSERVRRGRSMNAIAEYLRSRLRVPNVYLVPGGAIWKGVDIVAVDSAGSGDIHAVQVKLEGSPTGGIVFGRLIEDAKQIPAHYRYLATSRETLTPAMDQALFSADGIGRVGVFAISEPGPDYPGVKLIARPERFRIAAGEAAKIEKYLEKAKPDMFVRL